MMDRMGPSIDSPREMERAADGLAAALAWEGVRHLFGMPGSHCTTVYDAIARHGFTETILVRNEQAGAFAADGYARVSGRPGVICTTAGPGATNALTGIAEAWADSIPVLLLTGQVNADRMHLECGAYHEIPLEALLAPVTKFCATVRSPGEVDSLVSSAFAALCSGRPRPAGLILPQDVMRAEMGSRGSRQPRPPAPLARPAADDLLLAASVLSGAERPVILAGGGALWSGAADALRGIAERLKAPVVTSLNAKGILDERDPLSLGHARSARAKVVLPLADAMLAVGCRFTEVMTDWRRMPVPRNLVQIDLEPSQIGMNHPVSVGLVGDAAATLEALAPLIPRRSEGGWGKSWNEARAARPAAPEWLIETLREVLPDDAPVFTDACEIGYRMHTDYPAHRPRTFFYPSNYIALGWGFPAALGASVALGKHAPVVSVSGDGGFLMTAQELATAVRYGLKVVAIIHNDSTYGAIKNIQKRNHDGFFRDVDLNNPDFLRLAGAYGVPAERAADCGSFRRALESALERSGPSVIEVPDQWRMLR